MFQKLLSNQAVLQSHGVAPPVAVQQNRFLRRSPPDRPESQGPLQYSKIPVRSKSLHPPVAQLAQESRARILVAHHVRGTAKDRLLAYRPDRRPMVLRLPIRRRP